mmetsp:Transcript_13144/g.17035  ORF Transcript_13144/g.17035 Transcript_13144/m.17035 type:complete len:163 (-) Transcript_13144:168-656(-)
MHISRVITFSLLTFICLRLFFLNTHLQFQVEEVDRINQRTFESMSHVPDPRTSPLIMNKELSPSRLSKQIPTQFINEEPEKIDKQLKDLTLETQPIMKQNFEKGNETSLPTSLPTTLSTTMHDETTDISDGKNTDLDLLESHDFSGGKGGLWTLQESPTRNP